MCKKKSIRVEIMLLQLKKKMHSKQFWVSCLVFVFCLDFFFNLLPKQLKAINVLLGAHILGFIIAHNCKVLLWSAQL